MMLPALRFTIEEAELASKEWGFNCGPAALCALLGLTPDEVRSQLPPAFEQKRFMNPTMMFGALRSLGREWHRWDPSWPSFGIVRVQWGGPWLKDSVPVGVRYRHTHWVASVRTPQNVQAVFDINAFGMGAAWVSRDTWESAVVPELLVDVPRNDGTWSVTHGIEVSR